MQSPSITSIDSIIHDALGIFLLIPLFCPLMQKKSAVPFVETRPITKNHFLLRPD
jgi:hypothetical protein